MPPLLTAGDTKSNEFFKPTIDSNIRTDFPTQASMHNRQSFQFHSINNKYAYTDNILNPVMFINLNQILCCDQSLKSSQNADSYK